jgi:hypothetical protein
MMLKFIPSVLALLASSSSPCWQEPGNESETTLSLRREFVTRVPSVRDISDMRLLNTEDAVVQILVAGTCGAFELDLAAQKANQEVKFELPCPPYLPSMIVDADGDGQVEFARFSSGWTGPTAVIERDGTTRWAVETPARCNRPLDVDRDGRIEVLVANPNSRRVRLLDHEGGVVWEQEWKGNNVEATAWDIDQDGGDELLYVDGKVLRVCHRDGSELFATTPPGGGYVNAIELVQGDDLLEGAMVLVGTYVSDGRGKGQWYHAYKRDAKSHLAKYQWDEVAPFIGAQRIEREGGDLLLKIENLKEQARIAGFKASELRLSVSNTRGEPLFEDRLSKPNKEVAVADGVAVLLSENPLQFLVGYGDKVWEYTEQ